MFILWLLIIWWRQDGRQVPAILDNSANKALIKLYISLGLFDVKDLSELMFYVYCNVLFYYGMIHFTKDSRISNIEKHTLKLKCTKAVKETRFSQTSSISAKWD